MSLKQITPNLVAPRTAIENPVALEELRKFFGLATKLNKPLTMFSGYIDDAWHGLMETPAHYEAFCKPISGHALGHIPSGQNTQLVEIEWLGAYEKEFGQLNELWFADETGHVNVGLYEEYLRTGRIVDSWRCSPSSGSTGST